MATLAEFEYRYAETINRVVQSYTSWITCDNTNSTLVNGLPKVSLGDKRIEIGNFQIREKATGKVWPNTHTFYKTPGNYFYFGTDTDGYLDFHELPTGITGGSLVVREDTAVKAFPSLPQTLDFKSRDFTVTTKTDSLEISLKLPENNVPQLPTDFPWFGILDAEHIEELDGNNGVITAENQAIFDRPFDAYSPETRPLLVENVAGNLPVFRFDNSAFITRGGITIGPRTDYYVLRFNGLPDNGAHMITKEIRSVGGGPATYADSSFKIWAGGNYYDSQSAPPLNKFLILTVRIGHFMSIRVNDAEGPSMPLGYDSGLSQLLIGFGNIFNENDPVGINTANMDLVFKGGGHGLPTPEQDIAIINYLKYKYAEFLELPTDGVGGLPGASSGVRFLTVPGNPILGTPTLSGQPFTQPSSEILNGTTEVALPAQNMIMPFAAVGKKRRNLVQAKYLSNPATYNIKYGVEVPADGTFNAPSPTPDTDALLVAYWDVTDGKAYPDNPVAASNDHYMMRLNYTGSNTFTLPRTVTEVIEARLINKSQPGRQITFLNEDVIKDNQNITFTNEGASIVLETGDIIIISFKSNSPVINPEEPANVPPTVNAGSDTTATVGTSKSLTATASDSDGSIAAYAWAQVSGPNTLTLQNANTATVSFADHVAGTYVLRCTVTDDDGATTSDDITVTVSAAPAETSDYQAAVLADNPIFYNRLNGAGLSQPSLVGPALTLPESAQPGQATAFGAQDAAGKAVLFSGTGSATSDGTLDLQAYPAISIEYWYYQTSVAAADWSRWHFHHLREGQAWEADEGALLFMENTNLLGNGAYFTGVSQTSGSNGARYHMSNFTVGWHHVVVTLQHNGSVVTEGKLYLDGQEIPAGGGGAASITHFNAGRVYWMGAPHPAHDLAIYPYALSLAQAQSHFNFYNA